MLLPHHLSQRAIAAAVAGCFTITMALAQPAGPSVIHGAATITQQGARTTVTTQNGAGTSHSAIDWQRFGVPLGHGVFFSQPGAQSTSINRVLGPDPSAIFGTLGSNGRLVLVNPAGIAVGAGAVVDTAGFTASTLGMSRVDAAAGRLRFGAEGVAAQGALSVQGQVVARGGDVVLIAPHVETGAHAVVESVGGDTILAAGQKIEVTGRGVEGIRMQIQAPTDRAVNLGALKGDSVAMFASQLRHSGLIQAQSATVSGGRVILKGGEQAQVSGRITASSAQAGGAVHVSAERLILKASAMIDVSHLGGGGEILAGGGWQGKDTRVANARAVDVEAGVILKADAQLSGAGGTVVVWGDDVTRFRGAILSRGAGGGSGGRAEVSGKRLLVFRGNADLGSDTGRAGTLLLDPAVVTIQAGTGDGNDTNVSSGSFGDLLGGLGTLLLGDGPANYTIYESELEGMNANIAIQATQRIQAAGSFGGNELSIGNNSDLRLEVVAGGAGGIDIRGMPVRTQGNGKIELITTSAGQDIQADSLRSSSGDITLNAAASRVQLGAVTLQASGGSIAISGNPGSGSGVSLAGTSLTGVATLSSNNASVDFSGSMSLSNLVTVNAPTASNSGTLAVGGSGRLALGAGTAFSNNAGASILLAGSDAQPLSGAAGATLSNAGTITKQAGSAGLQTAGVVLSNTGTVNVNQGRLVVSAMPTNSGTVWVANGATLGTAGGALTNAAGATLAGGGTVDLGAATLSNQGSLRPGGTGAVADLNILGNLAQGGPATTFLEVAAGGIYDRVLVSGSAQLGGILDVAPLAYSPGAGDNYMVARAGAMSGSFASINAGAFSGFTPAYGGTQMDFAHAPGPAPGPVPTPAPVSGGSGGSVPIFLVSPSAPPTAPRPQPVISRAQPVPQPSPAVVPAAPVPVVQQAQTPPAPAFGANELGREVESFFLKTAWLQAESSDPQRRQRQVAITALQCRD